MNRWQRLVTVDGQVLSEVYRDRGASPAVATVVVVIVVSSLGGLLWAALEGRAGHRCVCAGVGDRGSLAASGLFFVWAGLVALLTWQGQRPEPEALAATVRTLAFAAVPFGWSFLIFVPGIEYPITLIALGLLLLSTTLATQTAAGGGWGEAGGVLPLAGGAVRADEPGRSVRVGGVPLGAVWLVAAGRARPDAVWGVGGAA